MSISPQKLEEKMSRRRSALQRNGRQVIESYGCPETGAGVVLARSRYTREPIETAYFFRPRTLRNAFREEKITSNHERLTLKSRLDALLKAEAEAKVAPHDLKVGEIMACIWGVTMQDVKFYRVTEIPHPRKIKVVPIGKILTGDWMSGTAVPDEQDMGNPDAGTLTFMVDMTSGSPVAKTGVSIERMSRWSGQPVHVYSD